MTDYTITTDFGAKDSLPSGNAAKVIKGSEFTTEFTNIKTAVNSKADTAGDTFTGAVTFDAAVTLNADVTFDTNTLFVDVSENKVGIGNVAPATALDVTGTVTASGLTVDTDTLHVDATNDRVGVGTTSPSRTLHIKDAIAGIRLEDSDGTSYGEILYNEGSNGLLIRSDENNADSGSNIIFEVDGSERLRIDSSGNVGIGTTSPNYELTVAGGGNNSIQIVSSTTGTGANNGLRFWNTGSSTAMWNYDNTPTLFATNNTERMRIDSSGNVGIGTSSPDSLLEVVGADPILTVRDTETGLASTNATLRLAESGAGDTLGNYWDINYTSNSALRILSNTTERMRIDSSGNVGIGTTSPLHKVDITGDESTTYDATNDSGQSNHDATLQIFNKNATDESFASLVFRNRTSGVGISRISSISKGSGTTDMAFVTENSNVKSEKLRIKADGNVGIGTTSPTGDLTIGRNGNASGGNIMLGSTTNATNKYAVITSQSYNSSTDTEGFAAIATQGISGTNLVTIGGGIGEVDSATQLRFYTSSATGTRTGSERMRIDSSGDLMVGTTSEYAFNGGFSVKTGTVPFINVGHASSVASGNYYAAFRHGTNTLGTITQNGTTGVLYNTSSDERLKENIADSADAGSKVDAIQIRQFDWIADGSHQDYGVIAQELVTVAPEAVHQPEDSEEMMGVDYSKLVPMLIKEVQTLRNRVAQLENN